MHSAKHNKTLSDVIHEIAPNGTVATVAELLMSNTDFLDDITYQPANGVVSHRNVIRTGLPDVVFRELYQGVQPTKSTTATVDEPIGMLEARSVVDSALLKLNKNSAQWRLNEEGPFIQAMRNKIAECLFSDKDQGAAGFTGLAKRFSKLDSANGRNIINAGGAKTTNTSIWLVVWSPTTVHMVYPENSTAGLDVRDLGENDEADELNRKFRAHSTLFQWNLGLSVRDWRHVVRIANIDTTALTADATAGANLLELMARACRRVESLTAGRAAFYMNRDTAEMLDLQGLNQVKNSTLSYEDIGGRPVTTFRKIPVRVVDAIGNDEKVVK